MFRIRFASLVSSVVALVVSIVAFLVVSTSPLSAQVQQPEIEWERFFGGDGPDFGGSALQTVDGGYVVCGTTTFRGESLDAYIAKTDSNGELVWERVYGGAARGLDECGEALQQTSERGFILVGSSRVFQVSDWQVHLIKVDESGNPQWEKTYGGEQIELGFDVQQTNDGGYVVTGRTESFGLGFRDLYLIKVDANGELVWQKTYGGEGWDHGKSVQQTTDGGYVVGGTTVSGGPNADFYLVKTDINGNLEWQKTFGVADWEHEEWGESARQTVDGGYIIVGFSRLFGGNNAHYNIYLVKADARGNLEWQRTFGEEANDGAFSVAQTADGGFVVSGVVGAVPTNFFGGGDNYLFKVDSLGNQIWQKRLGAASNYGSAVRLTSDGGYIVTGGSDDIYLVKLHPEQPIPRLNLYDPVENRWLPLTDQVRKDYFKPLLPVVVIVHGWDADLIGTLPTYTNDLAATFAARLPDQVNILAWDWMLEARGDATTPLDFINGLRPASVHVWDQSKKLARALQQTFAATDAHPTIHLMGHSLGAFLVALTAINLQSPSFGGGVYPVANVTLWDPPDRVPHSLSNNVPYLRRLGTVVDCISGTQNDTTYFSNVWVAAPSSFLEPEVGHDTYRWYQTFAPTANEPTLHLNFQCHDPILTTTVGFGASLTHALPQRQLRLPCAASELDVSLVADPLGGLCTPTDHLVFAQYCIAGALTPTPIATVRVDNGIGNMYCTCELPGDLRLRMQLRRPVGMGGGAGVAPESLEATYALAQAVPPDADSISFTYHFTAAPTPATFTVVVDDGEAMTPLFLATSDADLGAGDRDSTHLSVTPYTGKEVTLIFSLRSTQPDAIVEVSDLTYWRSATHGNQPPVAHAAAPGVVAATGETTLVTLDASASADPDGDELTFIWSQAGSTLATGPTPTVDLPLGVHQLTVHVRDPFDAVTSAGPLTVTVQYPFIRGDSNADGTGDISDPVATLSWLFLDASTALCLDAADANDDGTVDIADPIFGLSFLFLGSESPAAPFPNPGLDPTPDLLGCSLSRP